MALSNATVFEVRTGGADTNGGGFVTGAAGTDYSQQNSAQFSGTNLATSSGTTNPSVVTSATHNFVATDVGNLINISAGTNWTTGVYQIVSVAGNAATLDRACGTAASLSSGTWAVGGALLTIGKALSLMTVTGHQCYVAAGTYSISTGLATSSGISTNLGIIRLIGYNTTRGDLAFPSTLTRPVIQLSAAVTALTDANGGFRFENLTIDGNSKVSPAVNITGQYSAMVNCIIKNFAYNASGMITLAGNATSFCACEVTANSGTTAIIYTNGGSTSITNCYIHDNTCAATGAIYANAQNTTIENCIFANNTHATTHGIFVSFHQNIIRNNVFYNNAGDGINNNTFYGLQGEISGNIFMNNAGYGLNMNKMSPTTSDPMIHHNAYYNNTSGARNHSNAGTGDVTLTADPFTDAANGDFSLNNDAGGGALLKKLGFPGALIGGGIGYYDIGALQSPPPLLVNPQR